MSFRGLVKWFDVRHGCGLIARHDGLPDCLMRQNGMLGTGLRLVSAGDPVEFDVTDGEHGPVALNVVRLVAHDPGLGPDVSRHMSTPA